MFRTGIPFGYHVAALVLLAGVGLGLVLLFQGCRRRSRRRLTAGAALVLGLAALVEADLILESLTEWNPTIQSDSLVIGTWGDDSEKVELRADHTFLHARCGQSLGGTWSRDDWNLRLKSETGGSSMRFIEFRRRLRLMTRPPEDPDMWDGDWGLKRRAE